MSVINDNIKQFIAEVEKFLQETIKSEKISKKAQEHKQLILDKLSKLFEESPYLRVSTQDSGKGKDNQDESLFTGGSSKSDGSEEAAYIDYGIPPTPASELQNAAFAGSLEKKQRKGSGLFGGTKFQTRWCVIHNGNFYYYVKADDKKQCGCFKLAGYKFKNNPDITKQKKDKELAFELYGDDKSTRVYQFVASNKADYESVKTVIECGGVITVEDEDELYEFIPPKKYSEVPTPPPPTPSRGALPQLPDSKPPSTRQLPPTPVEPPNIKKIQLNITCKPEEDFENKYFGKWDCKGDNPDELTFKKGDIVYILSQEFDEKSWWIGELSGKFGLVPKTYLTPAYSLVF